MERKGESVNTIWLAIKHWINALADNIKKKMNLLVVDNQLLQELHHPQKGAFSTLFGHEMNNEVEMRALKEGWFFAKK